MLFENLHELGNGGALLPNSDIDAIELLALVGALVDGLLVQNRIERDSGFTRLTIADDQFALATANGYQSIDRLQASCHWLMHRLARNNARGLNVDLHALFGLDWAFAVDRIAERVNNAAQKTLANRRVNDGAGALNRLAFFNVTVGTEDHDADIVGFQVQGHAADAVFELDHFARLDVVEAVNTGNTVADGEHLAHFGDMGFRTEVLDLIFKNGRNFCGADIHQPTSFIAVRMPLSFVRSEESTILEPICTIIPPMISESISRSISAPAPATSFKAALIASNAFDDGVSASVTVARVTPRS